MVGWHPLSGLNGHEFEQTPGDSEGTLPHCNPWGLEDLDMTERLNSNRANLINPNLFPNCSYRVEIVIIIEHLS